MVNKSLPIEKLRKHVVPFAGVAWQFSGSKRHVHSNTGNASLDLEGVGSDGDDGPPQALDGSVVAGGVGAMDTLADIAAAVVDMAARVLAAAGAAGAPQLLQLGLRRSELRRWGHRAQPLSRRERE